MPSPEIVKTLTGKLMVRYTCSGCQATLKSPINDIGQPDACPNCQKELTVPGRQAMAEYAESVRLEKLEKAKSEQKKLDELRKVKEERKAKDEAVEESAKVNPFESGRMAARSAVQPGLRDDIVGWAVRQTRTLLGSCLMISLATIAAIPIVTVGFTVYSRSQVDLPPYGWLNLAGIFIMTFVFCTPFAVVMIAATGVIGVLFEIEKNTRILRLRKEDE